jgi:hypothetical protein
MGAEKVLTCSATCSLDTIQHLQNKHPITWNCTSNVHRVGCWVLPCGLHSLKWLGVYSKSLLPPRPKTRGGRNRVRQPTSSGRTTCGSGVVGIEDASGGDLEEGAEAQPAQVG